MNREVEMLIGISGKIGAGKDLIGRIILLLTAKYKKEEILDILSKGKDYDLLPFLDETNWEVKKFADKLKDIVCLLIGCTREDLEDIEFKNKELGEEWRVFYALYSDEYESQTYLFESEYDRDEWIESLSDSLDCTKVWDEILTPRKLLQLIGTECGRNIIHPNIWINATMADYKYKLADGSNYDLGDVLTDIKHLGKPHPPLVQPNWIITDLRFPNEASAIKNKNGINIRVNKFKKGQIVWWNDPEGISSGTYSILNLLDDFCEIINDDSEVQVPYSEIHHYEFDKHESEIALDDYEEFDYIIINNDNNISELIDCVESILIALDIINEQ